MGYEVLTAFFLEAGFLGIMLFGVNRVPKPVHFLATLAVAVGALISAFWILAANSWMQTPAGYSINEAGQFVPEDWLADHLQPVLPLPARPHGARRLSRHRLPGRRDRRLASPRRAGDGATTRTMFSMAHVDGGVWRRRCR